MRTQTKLMLAVVGTLAMAASVTAQDQAPVKAGEQVQQRTEEQLRNAGESSEVRTREQLEQQLGTQSGQTAQKQKRVYGEALMTEQERYQYQQRLQTMNDDQERKAFRKEHKEMMKERAKEQGKVLDEDGNVLTGDQLRDRDRDRDMDGDKDRDQTRQMDQTSRPATAPVPGQGTPPGKGGGRGG